MPEPLSPRISIQLVNVVLSAETVFLEWYVYSDRLYKTENIFKLHYLKRLRCQQQQNKLSIFDQKKYPGETRAF